MSHRPRSYTVLHTYGQALRERAQSSHRVTNLRTGISYSHLIRSFSRTSNLLQRHPPTEVTVTHTHTHSLQSPPDGDQPKSFSVPSPLDAGYTRTQSPPNEVTPRWRWGRGRRILTVSRSSAAQVGSYSGVPTGPGPLAVAPRHPRRPQSYTRGPGLARRLLRPAAAAGPGLTSLLLAEEAALGVGERCKVTRAMAAPRRPGTAEAWG